MVSRAPPRKRNATRVVSPPLSRKPFFSSRVGLTLASVALAVAFLVKTFHAPRWEEDDDGEEARLARHHGAKRLALEHVWPHDGSCYTQGLVVRDGVMFESCGMYGQSRVRAFNPRTGEELRSAGVEKEYFAEGIEVVNGKLLMLTWRERELLVFDANTLQHEATEKFATSNGQGWGIASNGTVLVVTDGSHVLHFWDAETRKEIGRLPVIDPETGKAVRLLNEIEFVGKYELLANIWYQEKIVRIDSRSGRVIGWYDFANVLKEHGDSSGDPEVMNGIAFDKTTGRLFVTGKRWKSLFEVKL